MLSSSNSPTSVACVLCRQPIDDSKRPKGVSINPSEIEPCLYDPRYASLDECGPYSCPGYAARQIHLVHETCYEILVSSYDPPLPTWGILALLEMGEFGLATKPFYKPLNQSKHDIASVKAALFSQFTRPILKSCFSQEFLRRFPEEILDMIAEFIGPCQYLIVLGESRRLIDKVRGPSEYNDVLNLSIEIHISRTNYQGISYISRVTNNYFGNLFADNTSSLLRVPPGLKRIVLSSDHIGVRRIQFLEEGSGPSEDGSPWYQTIDVPEPTSNEVIRLRHNVGAFIQTISQSVIKAEPL